MEVINPNVLQPVITLLCAFVPGFLAHNSTSNAPSGPRTRQAMEGVHLATGIGVLATVAIGALELLSGQGIGAGTINAAIATTSIQVGGRLGE